MPSYILPQVIINQLFNEVPLNTIRNQNCLVFGPNFQIFRYKDEDTREKIYLGHFDGSDITDTKGDKAFSFDYPEQPSNSTIDTEFTKLYADNVVVKLGDLKGFTKLEDDESGADLDGRIKFDDAIAGKQRSLDLLRDVEVGDVIRIKYKKTGTDEEELFTSSILEVFASEPANPERIDSVRIMDTLPPGLDLVTDSADVQKYLGDVTICASVQNIVVPRRATTPGEWQWTSGEEKFYVWPNAKHQGENLTIDYLGERREIIEAELYLEYRVFLLGNTDTIHSLENSTDVAAFLGEITPDNPLAFGVNKCIQNSADRVVYYMATRNNSTEAYQEVLDAATRTDQVYFLIPLSQEDDVIDATKAHVVEMSTGTNKLWRVAFVSTKTPEENVLYTRAASTDGQGFFAVLDFTPGAPTGTLQFVENEGGTKEKPSTGTKAMKQVVAGDIVRLYTGEEDKWAFEELYDKFTVKRVVSNTVLIVKIPEGYKGEPVSKGRRVEVVHEYTYAEKAEMIAATSRALFSRRVYNVFPPFAQESDGTLFTGVHLAAASAGVASSVLPQQPITNLELTGIDDVPAVYETFSRTQLNTIAAGGTFIVMQDLPGDRVYIRHQISTEYSGNNLLKSELSITKNLDSISYYFAEAYKPFIGRYNITPALLEVLHSVAENALSMLESETAAGLYGPQVLPEGTEITSLYQDPVNQDHVKMHLKLNLPRPFNVLDLDLEVI